MKTAHYADHRNDMRDSAAKPPRAKVYNTQIKSKKDYIVSQGKSVFVTQILDHYEV